MTKLESFTAIKKFYQDPHANPRHVDWKPIFSPIESDAWECIQGRNLPFLPEYPVLTYFIDFGCPSVKVGLEVDGKEFHADIRKDAARDSELASHGWHIYRCAGHEVFRVVESPFDCEEWESDHRAAEYYLHSLNGVLDAISYTYLGRRQAHERYADWVAQTLEQHRLASFKIGR